MTAEPGMVRLLAVVGAVTPPGRLSAAIAAAVEIAEARAEVSASLLNLADHRISFADGRPLDRFDDDTGKVVARLTDADAVLLASPVYRGSITGALKNLLDLTPVEALRGKPVGIVAMGATLHHYLGVDWHLRAILAWFGALVVPTSVYLESTHFRDGRLSDAGAHTAISDVVGALVDMARARPGSLGPPPLASGRG
jgi:FMN reductase